MNRTTIHYLTSYHPYHGGKNTNFDYNSGMILSFKKGEAKSIEYWYTRLASKINEVTSEPFYIAKVTSSTKGKKHPGFNLLIPRLGRGFTILNPSSNLLKRDESIEKLAGGGKRAIEIHLSSLSVPKTCDDNRSVILIDDVTTTGNSLRAGISKLERAGYSVVAAIALGKTVS